mgnify:CR=1 FL=1
MEAEEANEEAAEQGFTPAPAYLRTQKFYATICPREEEFFDPENQDVEKTFFGRNEIGRAHV